MYTNPNSSLAAVSCSGGSNGLLTKGYTTFGSIPSFPNIGASNTPASYGVQTTIFITAVDAAYTFNVSPQAFNELNNGTGFESGKIAAEAIQVAASNCGM
ncbi:Epl1 protein [Suillus subaureus]|uniref:Epl1 protein n=1 Tax=Suillus subaureus TaxID=48587 RepID=A0A9P7JHL3_9AGAM|nr:Epl1 protein [Suillus subaureus]KAG1822839.1 Epl1 protein [Suillus subaureus]